MELFLLVTVGGLESQVGEDEQGRQGILDMASLAR